MGRVTIRDVGIAGLVTDIPSHELPPEAWSNVSNVRFFDRKAARTNGETQVFGTPPVVPYYLFPSPNPTQSFWVYTNLAKVYAAIGSVHTNITRALGDYTGGVSDRWNGGWLNGVMVLNNGIDDPQMWNPIETGTALIKLDNWPASTKAKVIRTFNEFLIALDVTKSGTRYPTMFKWSHPADPGTVPVTWDPSDATKIAGEKPIGWTSGFIIDGLQLGQSFMVYKEDAFVRISRIATNEIFSYTPISLATGIMAQQCAVEFQPNMHCVLTLDCDVVVTEGQSIRSVLDKQNRVTLNKRMDASRAKCFLVSDQSRKEVMICYPRVGSTYCDEAAVWNWIDGTWSFKDISPTLDIKAGVYDESAQSRIWNSLIGKWNEQTWRWNERQFVSAGYKLLGAFPTNTQIRQLNRGQKLGTTAYVTKLERQGLSLIGQARDGTPRNDPNVVKLITEVYPLINASAPMNVDIYVGAADSKNAAVAWSGPYRFDPTRDEKVDCYCEGRYIGVRMESADEVDWNADGYGLNITPVGEYM